VRDLDAKELSRELSRYAERVASYLLPGGKRQRHEWVCGSITGEKGGSLAVHLAGEKAGVWADFATGQSGDLLELWKAVKGVDFPTAMKESAEFIGYSPVSEGGFSKAKPASQPQHPKPARQFQSLTAGPVLDYLTQVRKLTPETLKAYGIQQSKQTAYVLPYTVDGKTLFSKVLGIALSPEGKKQMFIDPPGVANSTPCLFGWQAVPPDATTLVITEGELDAMSVYQMGYPAVSIPLGAGNGNKHDWIQHEWERLERFNDIYLCYDMDAAGQGCVREVAARLGEHRCRLVQLPYKDANEFLTSFLAEHDADTTAQVFKSHLDDAIFFDPEFLKASGAFRDDMISYFYPDPDLFAGRPLPFDPFGKDFLIRPSELVLVTGFNGSGKSQMVGQIALQWMAAGERACIFSGEMRPRELLGRMGRQAGTISVPSRGYVNEIADWLDTRLWLVNRRGSMLIDDVLQHFTYAYRRHGCKLFVIDSLMKLGIGEKDLDGQKLAVDKMTDFKDRYGVTLLLVAHPRKGMQGESDTPGKSEVKGSGTITDLCDSVISAWRDRKREQRIQDGDDSAQSIPAAKLSVEKQRNGDGQEPTFKLWYDIKSFQFTGGQHEKPRRYVPYNEACQT
jgi:twinkle protein